MDNFQNFYDFLQSFIYLSDQYTIGNAIIEIVDEIMIKVNGDKTDLRKLEDNILNSMVNQ